MNLNLQNYIKFHSPGYVISIYNNSKSTENIFGNRETKPSPKACTVDTLYDIASLTKVYTATLVYSPKTIILMLSHDNRNEQNCQILKTIVPSSDINQMYQTVVKLNPNLKL